MKAHWKGKVSWRELLKMIKEVEIFTKIKECEISPSLDEELSSIYVSWEDSGPKLMVGPLLEDILKDLNVRVMTGTEKDLALYETKTGTYAIGRSAIRLIIKEVINRVKSDGDLVLECVTPQNISKIKSLAPALSIEVGNEFETMLFLLCVGNGVVDLRIPYLIDWSPDYYMVQSTPVKYIPDKDWRELAPTFAKALERTFDGCLDRIEYFQRYMGYCATGETTEDAILILIGVGGTGKSTMLDIVRKALGGDGYVRVIKADLQGKSGSNSPRDGIARARYARMLILKELEKDNNLSWGTLKELASNSSVIEARKLYGGTENFHLMSKPIIDTNFLPKADEPDRSILRRLKPLPFRHIMTEEEKDPAIFNKIVENELPGVLAWIVEGARKWYESGLGNPAFIDEELSIYKTSMDTHLATSWLEQSGHKVEHSIAQLLPEKWIPSTKLYADYRKYAMEGGVQAYSIQEFSSFLETRGARKDQKIRTIENKKERSMFWLNIDRSPAD
jgi:P4 family phage/plasmid primase-like protien